MHGILKQTNSWESLSLLPRNVARNKNIYTSLIWMVEKNIYCTLNMIYETITYSCVVSNRTIHLTDYYSSWHYSASFRSSLAKCQRLSENARIIFCEVETLENHHGDGTSRSLQPCPSLCVSLALVRVPLHRWQKLSPPASLQGL